MKKIFLCLIFLMIASISAASVFAADIDNVNLDNDSASIVDNQNGINSINDTDDFVLVDSDDSISANDDVVLINQDDDGVKNNDFVPVSSGHYISNDNSNHFGSDDGAFNDFFNSVFNKTNKGINESATNEGIFSEGIFSIFDPFFNGYDIILVDPVDPNNIPDIHFNDYTHSNLDNVKDVTFGNFGDATLQDLQ